MVVWVGEDKRVTGQIWGAGEREEKKGLKLLTTTKIITAVVFSLYSLPSPSLTVYSHQNLTMVDPMLYTLGQASQATGKTKTAIADAVKKGRISATRDESGRYQIDPAELHRVYPMASSQDRKDDPKTEHYKTHDLTAKIMLLEAQLQAMAELKDQIATERDDLRCDRDHWRTQAQARLPAPEAPARRKWFHW